MKQFTLIPVLYSLIASGAYAAGDLDSEQLAMNSLQKDSTKPNIIVIFTDDHGYADLGIQDQLSDIKTPHIV